MDIQVGDRITYIDDVGKKQKVLIYNNYLLQNFNSVYHVKKILKKERPKYEVIEEEKELLTEEEKEFLKQYIKIIENLNNGKVKSIYREEVRMTIILKTGLNYYIEVGTKFGNMTQYTTYTLEELGLKDE